MVAETTRHVPRWVVGPPGESAEFVVRAAFSSRSAWVIDPDVLCYS